VDAAPDSITIWYTDAIDIHDSWIRVFDANGVRIDLNNSSIPAGSPRGLTVGLPPDLSPGVYRVSWRNLSVDGDGLDGSFSFGVSAAAPSESSHGDHGHGSEPHEGPTHGH
jgi:methionine-rich copper-binding protein CopC